MDDNYIFETDEEREPDWHGWACEARFKAQEALDKVDYLIDIITDLLLEDQRKKLEAMKRNGTDGTREEGGRVETQ